jgi:hypothetical protein
VPGMTFLVTGGARLIEIGIDRIYDVSGAPADLSPERSPVNSALCRKPT